MATCEGSATLGGYLSLGETKGALKPFPAYAGTTVQPVQVYGTLAEDQGRTLTEACSVVSVVS